MKGPAAVSPSTVICADRPPFHSTRPPTTDLREHGMEDGGCCLLSLHPHRGVLGAVHLGEGEGGEGGD